MRSFLGVGRNAPIVALTRDRGWLPIATIRGWLPIATIRVWLSIATITKLNCIIYWIRLSNMIDDRLNKQVFSTTSTSCRGYATTCASGLSALR